MDNKNLQLGDSGEEVKILQEKLKILGYYNPIVTGSFGPATLEGVKAFQREYGLEETGIVNQEMWNLLFSFTDPAIAPISVLPNLSIGSTGSFVGDLQTKLKTLLYYTGPINNNFDLETENAVKRFQYNNDITANGIVNDTTWDRLNALYGNLNPCVLDQEEQGITTYTVKSGDTLYAIASRFNTTVDAIKRLNNLTSNTLQIGQVLKIPTEEKEESTTTYTVKRGDTLYAIASRFNTTVDAIKRLNNLTSNTLQIGQVLQIPTEEQEESSTTYTVKRGDTLYAIASRFNTTVDEIKRLNNLTSNTLQIGQILKIPTSNNMNYISYIVVNGDTLYAIARRYNTTVDTIKKLNNLTSNILQIGQVLKIPSANPIFYFNDLNL